MNKLKCFYEILEESLKGKRVRLRNYDTGWRTNGHECYKHNEDGEIIYWNDELPFEEWTGTVKAILRNDNSHVDIIFDENLPRTKPGDIYLDDCFNWRMGDYIEILETSYNIMPKELISLNQHNIERIGIHYYTNEQLPVRNGIECPNCGEELYDSHPDITLTSNPPQKNIHCSKCDYHGTRLA